MRNALLVILVALMLSACHSIHRTDPMERRVDSIMQHLTPEQKVGQLHQLNGRILSHEKLLEKVRRGEVGCVMNVSGDFADSLQQEALRCTGIPLLIARDMIHGYHTLFPIPLAQACTWDTALVKQAACLSAQEMRTDGIHWTFSPMVDVVRDPRWGRVAESYGEDTWLTSVMGASVVRGYHSAGVASTVKHFVGYGAAEGGRDYNTTWIPEVQLRNTYLPPFKAALDAGCEAVMASFNEVQGVPLSANRHLLTDILRKEWGFDRVIDSDYGAIEQLVTHGVAADKREAATTTITAGIDMDMESHAYSKHLVSLMQEGIVPVDKIDDAVKRILMLKMQLGLFDNPYPQTIRKAYDEEALTLAARMAAESAVLLKNNGILPLTIHHSPFTILVTGPLANSEGDQVGCWSPDYEPGHGITPLQAVQKRAHTVYSPGLRYSREENPQSIEAAVRAAAKADIILNFTGEEQLLSGEAQSLADINLRKGQRELLRQLAKTGKPIVMVVMAGRPLTIEEDLPYADAVIYAYHGGTMAGEGIAQVLFGETNPCGKLTMTIPRHVGQIPIYYNHTNTGRPAKQDPDLNAIPVGTKAHPAGALSFYLDYGTKPLFPFGYGLSYTTFEFDEVILSDSIMRDEPISVSCTITNTGSRDGYEVAQLYVRDKVGQHTRPIRELKGFQKIFIPAGESRTVQFTLKPEDLSYWHEQYKDGVPYYTNEVESGYFGVWISPDSQSGIEKLFYLK